MKQSWLSNLVIAGVMGLLTLFLGLQYNWLLQASEAERERLQKRVNADTKSFADDFNKEIQAAFFNFQADAAVWKNADYAEFNKRFDYWKSNTEYPELIQEIIFFGKDPAAAPLLYDAEKQVFENAESSERIDAFRKEIASADPVPPLLENGSVLVVPIYEAEKRFKRITIKRVSDAKPTEMHAPEADGYLVVSLDRPTITGRIIPKLAAKYFADGDFNIEVVGKTNEAVYRTAAVLAEPDAMASLFDLTPDNFIFFSNRDLVLPRTKAENGNGVVFDQRVESHTFTRGEHKEDAKAETFKIEVQAGERGGQRTAVIAGTTAGGDPWRLNVQHTAGSVDAFIRGQRNRSFVIGLGVYLLLIGSILAIVLSATRSKRFAQRQIDFVSSVSHEFRTPLAVIYSAGENLADGIAKDETQVTRYGNLIKGEGRKLTGMVEQILEFAGARSGRKKYNFSSTDIANVTEGALHECLLQLEEKGFEIETNIVNALPNVRGDAEALSSAIQNLIQNSIKYSNGSRWLRVSAENGDGTIKISVEDRGIGIAPGDLKQIFTPFYRTKEVVDAQINGNGLGLSLVKQIAEAHGGKVSAESEVGKGSKFVIEIPQKDI